MTNERTGKREVHILLVEDNPADVELLRRALIHAKLDCRLTVLDDGAQALAFVRGLESETDGQTPDLAILDLNLPKNDGLDVLQAMRTSPCCGTIPVAILSSSPSARERTRIEQYGIVQFITKPADLDEFLGIGDTLKQLLASRRGAIG